MALMGSIEDMWNWTYNFILSKQNQYGIQAVFKGDQRKVAQAPTVCVEPGTRRRTEKGAQRIFNVETEQFIIIYVGAVDNPEVNQEDAVKLAEALEAELHEHAQVGGLAIHSYVSEIEPGYATRANTVLRAARMTFNILSEDRLPASAP